MMPETLIYCKSAQIKITSNNIIDKFHLRKRDTDMKGWMREDIFDWIEKCISVKILRWEDYFSFVKLEIAFLIQT